MQILIIEPDFEIAELIKKYIEKHSEVSVRLATSSQQAIDLCDSSTPDLILLEIALAGQNGIAFLHELRSYGDWSDIPVIIHTNLIRDESLIKKQLNDLNVQKYFYKYTTDLKTLNAAISDTLSSGGYVLSKSR